MFDHVLDFPVRDGLLAYVEILKEDALEEYRQEVLAYRIRGGEKPPEVPAILKEPKPTRDEREKRTMRVGNRMPPPRPP